MPLKVAILEDNLDRQGRMQAWLNDRLYMYEHFFFDEAQPLIQWLRQNLGETLVISLDHDLDLKPSADGRWLDAGTGREVADFLANQAAACPVVIHSTNYDAVLGMESVLTESGWHVAKVQPYGDLAWIDEAWWPLVKEQLRLPRRGPARTVPVPPRLDSVPEGDASPHTISPSGQPR